MGVVTARLDSVAKFICAEGEWKVSNLRLQKIMFMAQMFYMGEHDGERLFDASFEAWDYGPVIPQLYHKVKAFGSSPVEDVFYHALPFAENSPRRLSLKEVCSELLKRTPGQLVEISHWDKGAWAKHYVPRVRGISIPDADIRAEYSDRLKQFSAAAK